MQQGFYPTGQVPTAPQAQAQAPQAPPAQQGFQQPAFQNSPSGFQPQTPGFQPQNFSQPPQQQRQLQPTNSGRFQNPSQRYNDQMEDVAKVSYPANHLLLFQLKRIIYPEGSRSRDYKDHYFFFVMLAPGVVQSNGSRSYDFQQNKTVQKFSLREICSLAFVLQQCAIGNTSVLPYVKFSNNENVKKNLSVLVNVKPDQNNNPVRQISIMVSGTNRNSVNMSPGEAYGIADQLMKLYEYGMKLEIEAQENSPRTNYNNTEQSGNYYNPQGSGGYNGNTAGHAPQSNFQNNGGFSASPPF